MPAQEDPKLPCDGWIALHQDGTVCLDWDIGSLVGGNLIPLVRFREKMPNLSAECLGNGESLEWTRVSLMTQNAAVRMGGAVRMIDDE